MVGGPTLAPPHIKLEKSPKFSGKHSELENFLFAMRLYLDSSGLKGQNASRFLVSYLVGDALKFSGEPDAGVAFVFDDDGSHNFRVAGKEQLESERPPRCRRVDRWSR